MNIRLPGVLAVLQFTVLAAIAHPVAQGAMEIVVGADSIDVRARVSSEEAFVAEAFGRKANANTTLDDVWRRHGQYLLAHVHLTADGTPLAGRVAGITAPAKTTREDRITYDLRFDFPKDRHRPGAIVLRQDVLNEFIFAPGNPWEASYIVRISQQDRLVAQGLLFTSRQPLAFTCNRNVAAAQSAPSLNEWAMAMAFVRHGIQHILGGYDHLLFVAGLVLAVASIWDLVKVVTAFTLAHTLTLTLAVLDVVRLSNHIVEPMIAASIVFVALQNLFSPSRSRGWMRLAVAFGFGLFHGLGFAGGLLSAMEGMAGVAIIVAIGGFSFGVEIGHQLVALPLFGVLKIARVYSSRGVDPEWIPRWIMHMGSSAICAAGVVYLVAALR
jgi:hypothetical protein